MTIEVRQLVIRAVVTPTRPSLSDSSEPLPHRVVPEKRAVPTNDAPPLQSDLLVAACVREVLRKLQRAQQR